MYTLIYSINNEVSPETVYVNLTNACTNKCVFCLREQKDDVCGAEMWHDDEYTLDDIIEQFEKYTPTPKQVVFCGYGEPFLRKEMMKAFSKYLKDKYPTIKVRVNTNGHANAIYRTNVIQEFKGLLDEVSVSLNSDNVDQYDRICNPRIKNAHEEVLKFIKACVDSEIETVASVVTGFSTEKINIENCEKLATELGAKFRNREFIENGY